MIPSPGQIYNDKHLKAFIMSTFKAFWLTEYNRSKDTNIKDKIGVCGGCFYLCFME